MKQFTARHPWAILAAGAAIQILTGLPAAWGVFQQPVMDEFSLTEDGAGYAFGILIAAFGVGCVIGGFLQDKKGPRCAALWGTGLLCGGFFAAALLPGEKGAWFWAVFSIPAGLGTAFLYPSIQSCAQKWYAGRKGLATGVIGGAVGLSGAFLTGFVRTALKGFGPVQGIRGAFWALGALTLPVCLVGSALLTDPPPAKQKPEEQGREKGIRVMDAPVSGGDSGARNATLSIMVGGDEADFAEAMPLFECMGKNIILMGPAGSGQHTKAANQIAVAGATAAYTEALVYAQKAGLDPQKMLSAIGAGAAGSWQLTNMAPRALAGDFAPGFFIKHFIKDMKIVQEESRKSGVELEMLDTVLALYEKMAQQGLENDGTQALIKYYQK